MLHLSVTGLVVLLAALAVAFLIGVLLRRRAGRFSRTSPRSQSAGVRRSGSPETEGAQSPRTLTAADLGAELGERATLVQFSTDFCAYCGPTRRLLGEVAAARPGVQVIEINAAERMDLTRRLRVLATPTVLVLGPDGMIAARSSGKPTMAAVLEAVGNVS